MRRPEKLRIILNDLKYGILHAKDDRKTAFFLSAVGKEAYALVKNLAFPDSPISLPYEKLKDILLTHIRPVNFEAAERAKFHVLIRREDQDI